MTTRAFVLCRTWPPEPAARIVAGFVVPCAAKYCSRSRHLLSTGRRDVEGSLTKPTNMPAKSQIGLGQNSEFSSETIAGPREASASNAWLPSTTRRLRWRSNRTLPTMPSLVMLVGDLPQTSASLNSPSQPR